MSANSLPDLAPTKSTGETVQIVVANCSAADAQFLRNIVAVLTDPKYAPAMDKVRTGNSAIHYEAGGSLTTYTIQRKP